MLARGMRGRVGVGLRYCQWASRRLGGEQERQRHGGEQERREHGGVAVGKDGRVHADGVPRRFRAAQVRGGIGQRRLAPLAATPRRTGLGEKCLAPASPRT
jgi:hypothetical protein